jgi:lysophospholipase L1-like esterase
MLRLKPFLCILLALILCAGCSVLPEPSSDAAPSAAPESPVPTPEPAKTPVPTSEPTASPTPTLSPSPEPTPSPTPEPITEERLDSGEFDSYFDDTLFLGDSITEAFSGFIRSLRETDACTLGTAKLFGVRGMNVSIACRDEASPSGRSFRYAGKPVSVTELINICAPKRVFIMLGSNDITDRPWDMVGAQFAQLIDTIHEKCPGVEIVMQSIPPIMRPYCELKGMPIDVYNSFNGTVLSEVCRDHDAELLDFSDMLKDGNGYLREDLCYDQQYHLTKKGELIWVRALRLYAAQQMCPGAETLLPEP